ncbi:MAG TPA: hypothetical protein VFI23_07110 [Rhizomicrobium sp.]|nr:hypothetical protein [Rhizomicrobium sp.]
MPRVTRKICLFCPRPATSGEHIFSNGLKDLFPKRGKRSRFSTLSADYRANGSITVIKNRLRRSHKGVPNGIKHYVVCGPCNFGWMSRLEKKTQPLLRKLIQGKSVTLGRREIRRLTRWCALKVLVTETGYENQPSIPACDHATIKRNGTLPDWWRIWILCSDGAREPGSGYGFASIKTEGPSGQELKLNVSANVLILGRLVIFATVTPGLRFNPKLAGTEDMFQPLFPARGPIQWPTKTHADHHILKQLPQALSMALEGARVPDEFIDD